MKNIFILSIIISLFSACGNKKTEPTVEKSVAEDIVELTDAQLKNVEISTGTIQQQDISSTLKVNGIIDVPPQNLVSVSVPLGGYLKSTKLLEGMHVRKGEVIATMEDPQYIQLQQDYLTAKAYFNAIEKEYLRQKDLNQSKASSDKVFEKAQTDYASQKVLIKSLAEKLKLIHISPDKLNENNISRSISIPSPIGGFVSSVKMNIGKYVSPSDVLFELINPKDIHLALTVFEKDLDKIFIGQKLIAYNNNQPDKKYTCKIILIGRDLSSDRSVTVHCHFENYDNALIPGMYMNAELSFLSQKALVVPDEAVVRFEAKHYVFCKTDKNNFQMLEVSIGIVEKGVTQISFKDNIDFKNKIFVTKGAYTLLMKLKNTEEE